MVELIHPPDPHTLLPVLLACLPTAFASYRPPPALLPLLSPILRQRLSYISSSDNWLKLLCWDRGKAETLWEQIENSTFEPHPSSGEIEVGDVNLIRYKRIDEETLKCQLSLADWNFTPIFLWCTGSQEGNGWQLAELLPSPELDESWSTSISEANDSAKERLMTEALREAEASSPQPKRSNKNLDVPKDEDDYWSQYDQSPGRTPARKSSIPLDQMLESDTDHYARYGEVQPAMDNHDPDEETQNGEHVESTLNGHQNPLSQLLSNQSQPPEQPTARSSPPHNTSTPPQSMPFSTNRKESEVAQPQPSSPSSRSNSNVVPRLEDAAERNTASEIGIKQHISASVKSMYRLAKSGGMGREEFEELMQREVEGLKVLDPDD